MVFGGQWQTDMAISITASLLYDIATFTLYTKGVFEEYNGSSGRPLYFRTGAFKNGVSSFSGEIRFYNRTGGYITARNKLEKINGTNSFTTLISDHVGFNGYETKTFSFTVQPWSWYRLTTNTSYGLNNQTITLDPLHTWKMQTSAEIRGKKIYWTGVPLWTIFAMSNTNFDYLLRYHNIISLDNPIPSTGTKITDNMLTINSRGIIYVK